MFAAASAEEDANSNLFCGHADSSLAFDAISVNAGGGYGGAKRYYLRTLATQDTKEHEGKSPMRTMLVGVLGSSCGTLINAVIAAAAMEGQIEVAGW